MKAREYFGAGEHFQVLGLTAGRGVAAALQAITYVLVARAADPSDLGRVLAALAVATAVAAVLDLGVSNHVMRELGRRSLTAENVVDLLLLRVMSGAAGASLWMVATSVWNPSLIGVGPFLMAESLLGLMTLTAVGTGRALLASSLLLVARGLSLTLVATLSASASVLPWFLAVGTFAGVAMGMIGLRDLARGRGRRPRLSPGAIRHTWPYMTTGVLAQLSNLDLPIVASIAGTRSAGMYGLPSRLTSPLMLVAQSHANVLLPRASAAWERGDSAELRRIRQSIVTVAVGCAAPLIGLALLAPTIVSATLGSDYQEAVSPLRVIVLAVAIATVNGPVIAMLQALGRARAVSRSLMVAVPVGLLGVAAGAAVGGAALAGAGLVFLQALVLVQLWPVLTEQLARPPRPWSGRR